MQYMIKMLKGIIIGIANAIPGVSGGTMMVTMGIYDDIISSITNLFHNVMKSIKTLLPYLIGMAIGIIGLSFVIEFLFQNYPLQTSMIFIGLILGGLPILVGKVKGKFVSVPNITVFLLFFAAIIGLQILGGKESGDAVLSVSFVSMIKLLFVGVIASATMVIPGVSGSLLLMVLGYYNPILGTIKSFATAVVAWNTSELFRCLGILVPFGIGVVIGIFAIAKAIELLLKHYEALTYSAILGLVIASPIVILMQTNLANIGVITIITAVITFAFGFGVSMLLGKE